MTEKIGKNILKLPFSCKISFESLRQCALCCEGGEDYLGYPGDW